QDPNGAYAAVIPRWVDAIIKNQPITINGDGETSRDFCYIDNVVQANIRSALAPDSARGKVYNIAAGGRTTLNQLFGLIRDGLAQLHVAYSLEPHYGGFRPGDVRHSHADIALARDRLGYAPTHDILAGLTATLPWYLANQTHFSKEA
ncbi:MAG: NAD-dependent epimerase/dehydratase family protein, partial [Alphaproteobacteria bacterium]|nr:NAD-dependent epimerase/dehydratase family protein [Alphaproteobacteria bacterium]